VLVLLLVVLVLLLVLLLLPARAMALDEKATFSSSTLKGVASPLITAPFTGLTSRWCFMANLHDGKLGRDFSKKIRDAMSSLKLDSQRIAQPRRPWMNKVNKGRYRAEIKHNSESGLPHERWIFASTILSSYRHLGFRMTLST
jgi:hypothetical protein